LFDWFHRCFHFIVLARYICAALVLAAAQMCFYWVKRKSRLKPARFFIRRGKTNYQARVLGTHVDSRSQFAPFRVSNAVGYAKFYSRSHDAVIRVTMMLAT
jgi:hypothetical protein